MTTIAFINQKGGVGKTTATCNIGAGLAARGKKVLLIDLDPQGNLSAACGVPAALEKTVFEVLMHEASLKEVTLAIENFHIIPANIGLSAFEQLCAGETDKEFQLKEALKNHSYDYILIDCPPSLGLLTLNALAAADEVYIPVQTEFLALQGLSQLLDTCKVINRRINPALKLGGIIGMRFNRRKLNSEIIAHLRESFKEKMFNTAIRENIALAEAPSFGMDIYRYKPTSIGAKDYKDLCEEIIQRTTT